MDKYFEDKKRRGYIFTMHDINPKNPYISMDPTTNYVRPLPTPGPVSWWSHLSGRYRDSREQREFLKSGCVDRDLGERRIDNEHQHPV